MRGEYCQPWLTCTDQKEAEVAKIHSYETFVLTATPITKISKKAENWLGGEPKMNLELVPQDDPTPDEIARQKFRDKVQEAGYRDVIEISEKDPNLGANLLTYAIIETAEQTDYTAEEIIIMLFPPAPGEELEPLDEDASIGDKVARHLRLVESIPELGVPDDEMAKGLSMRKTLEEKDKKS